jgi:hypothetical protein
MQSSQRSGVSSECLFRASERSYRQLLLLLACYLSNNLLEINYRYEVIEGVPVEGNDSYRRHVQQQLYTLYMFRHS